MILEICAGSYNSAVAAMEGGADRLELCSGLSEGGLTPSLALMKAVCQLPNIRKHILIRPRGGDFLYNAGEKAIILDDIRIAHDTGADGIVIGALLEDGRIDVPFLKECVKVADGMKITFHRAFDVCADPFIALEEIIDAGCTSILTSGQDITAEAGIPMIRQLVQKANGAISIMPGRGVSKDNVYRILTETGATEIHHTARSDVYSKMKYQHGGVEMGAAGVDEYTIQESNADIVRMVMKEVAKVGK